jgi:histidinol-phosphate aminotransferase
LASVSAAVSATNPALHRTHGGPDAQGAARHDFSTNSNACGPCPAVLAAVQQADATRYPDASYTRLRASLAEFHGVDAKRVLLAASASEFIFRITAWVAQQAASKAERSVWVPTHAYGDYAQAAQAWGLARSHEQATARLVWCCEPSSPLGGAHTPWPLGLQGLQETREGARHVQDCEAVTAQRETVVLDCAYAPLRLSGEPSLTPSQLQQVWQLFSPNKALGLTGVRAAYAIAPLGCEVAVQELDALAPSWPLGAHGVALLQAWVQPDVQGWLADSLHTLRRWKLMQTDMLQVLGWTCLPSDANFFCARPAVGASSLAFDLAHLRAAGIKLRDAASFGLAGHVRLSVQAPAAQDALRVALLGLNGLRQQASQGQRADFERFMCQVPDVSAQEGDEISSDTMEFGHVLSSIVNLHLI